jgi:formate dehydrogenase subunit gamma
MMFPFFWVGYTGMQIAQFLHGHIYIGSIGMEGAFAATWSSRVDHNWAREHHGLWE